MTLAWNEGWPDRIGDASALLERVEEHDDFLASTANNGDLPWHATNSGTASGMSANSSPLAGAIGFRTLTSGTSATGYCRFSRSELVSGAASLVSPWLSGSIEVAWRIMIPQLPVAGSDPTFSLSLGQGSTTANDHFTSGIGVRFNSSSPDWVLASRSAASDVATDTATIGPIAGAWQVVILRIVDGVARLYAGPTRATALAAGVRASVTMTGATTLPVAPMIKLNNTASVAVAKVLHLDFYSLRYALDTSR